LDAVWLCKVAERQMLRPSFVPPAEIRRLRDVTRYRCDLVEARTAEKQRVEKLLEDAQIKLSVVASDIFGVSGRQMMSALIAGQRDPAVLAQLARGRMRGKLGQLREAFTGYFTDHHGLLLGKMLARVDALSADIAELDEVIEQMIAPFAPVIERLDEIPGLGRIGAAVVVSEIGLDMTRFPTSGHRKYSVIPSLAATGCGSSSCDTPMVPGCWTWAVGGDRVFGSRAAAISVVWTISLVRTGSSSGARRRGGGGPRPLSSRVTGARPSA